MRRNWLRRELPYVKGGSPVIVEINDAGITFHLKRKQEVFYRSWQSLIPFGTVYVGGEAPATPKKG